MELRINHVQIKRARPVLALQAIQSDIYSNIYSSQKVTPSWIRSDGSGLFIP